jgi:tetratricopeptide (TPR) repeat protein
MLIAIALCLCFGGIAQAQSFGRLVLVVTDEAGEPVKDVKVTMTCEEITTFEQEKTTNKKGRAVLSVTDATHIYKLNLEHGAYPPQELEVQLQLGTTTNREITLSKNPGGAQAQAQNEEPAGGTVIYTPAERVFNEGVELLQGGDLAAAKDKFLAALEKDPDMGLAHSAMAGVYLEEKNYTEALASIQKFMESQPDSPRAIRMLYEAHSGLGNEKEAADALEQLKKLDRGGDTARMVFNEGVQATKVGDYVSAKKRFLEALDLQPELSEATGALAIIYYNEDSWAEAAAMAERHLGLRVDDQKMMQLRYDAYRLAGDAENAKVALDALVESGANLDALLQQFMNQGLKFFEAGQTENAIAEFRRVIEIKPDHAKAHYHLGISLVSTGDSAGAKEHLNKFIELAPNDPEAAVAKDMLNYL